MTSKGCRKERGFWRSKLKYVPVSDEHLCAREVYTINHNSPEENVSKLIDDSDMIRLIWVFKCPVITKWQLTELFLCHQLVLGENRTMVVVD